MKLLKPNWVSLDGSPIFSLDIHPDGSRYETVLYIQQKLASRLEILAP